MLKERGRVKTVIGNTALSLTADAGESFRIRGIRVYNPASAYLSVTVDKLLVQYLGVSGTQGNHAGFPNGGIALPGLFDWLVEKGVFRPIPIAKGQTIAFSGVNQAGSIQQLLYDVYDADDVRANEPNGIQSPEYDYISYGSYSTTLADGNNLLETQLSSVQFPAFPFGKVVPSKHSMILRGVAFSDVGKTSGTAANKQNTKYLRLIRDRETLFDEDRNGLLYYGAAPASDGTDVGTGSSQGGNLNAADGRSPLLFEPGLEFREGDDLDVYIETAVSAGSANLAAADCRVGFIFNVRRG